MLSEELSRIRALTTYDQAKRTATLRAQLELPTPEEFAAMAHKSSERWGTLLEPRTNPALYGDGPDTVRCPQCDDIVADGVWENILCDFGIICARCGAVQRFHSAHREFEVGRYVYWTAGVYPLPLPMPVLAGIPLVGEGR